ncbi:MAG: hypothetical protein GXO07_06865, partial [Crenarchaeota archaeon]|nr:hypothetical protein [Thermoproteota archaeon]
VVPLFLEEVGEVRGEERLDVEGSAGGIRAYPLGDRSLILAKRGDALELAIVDVPFETLKNFLKGEEGYEHDESAPPEGGGEEEEEEFEPE